jgi:uncharacterized RDD family membrane protein YckC
MRGYYAGFISRALALIIDLLIIMAASIIFSLVTRLLLNFFGLGELAAALYDRTIEPNTDSGNLVVTLLRWLTAFLTSATFLFVYLVFFWTTIGKTPGKAIVGVRVVQGGQVAVSFKWAIVRAAAYYLSALPLGLGFLWVLVDNERRGWHDKLARTYVLYDWDARLGRRLLDRLRRMRAGQLAAAAGEMVAEADDSR